MRLLVLVLLVAATMILSNCKPKDEPKEEIGNPVFRVEGSIDGGAFSLAAGFNDYFMFTSYSQDQFGVYQFVGNMAPQNCPQCPGSFKITIRNYKHQQPVHADSIDRPGDYPYFDNQQPIEQYYELACRATPYGNGSANVSWDFGNGKFSTSYNPTVRFYKEGIYPVFCSAVFPNGCFSVLSQPIYLTPTRVGKTIDFNLNHIDSQTVLLNSIPVNQQAQVKWDFGDGNTGNGTIVHHTYTNKGLYKVCMEYIAGTDTIQFCKNVNTLNFTDCKSNFYFDSKFVSDSFQYSKVTVEWIGTDGSVYSSANTEQPSSSVFTIFEAANYEPNSAGNKTRKYRFNLNCKASNGVNTIDFKNINGWFGYAYP